MKLTIKAQFAQVIDIAVPPLSFWAAKPCVIREESDDLLQFHVEIPVREAKWQNWDTMVLVPNVKGEPFDIDYDKLMGTYTLDCGKYLHFHNREGERLDGIIEFEFYYWLEDSL